MNKNTLLIAEYEQQLRINPQDIAARWKLVQARYEVVTVGDKLLLGRMDMPRIYTDRDAKLVLEGLQGEEKNRFLEQIKTLAASQEELVKAADTDSICDVYLAFDASSSEDASIARDIYLGLSGEGISVYYEPERKLYGDVDAHRLFALHHAKLLILVGTSAECMEKEATAGAWMRYLNIMEQDSTRHILPAYKGMNPKDFPGGLSKTQGIDVGRIGSVQAILIPRAMELIGAQDQVIVVKKADGKSVNLSNLLNRIELLLEDGEFEAARGRLEKFEEEYGTDFEQFHYLKLLEQAEARNLKELALAVNEDLLASSDYQYLMEKGSPKMKQELLSLEDTKAQYLKEQKEDAYIEEIREAHVNGSYDKVLKLVNEVKTMPEFSRWADIQAFYQAAITRKENQKLREEFLKLVGNGKDFYLKQLKKKEPDKYWVLTNHDSIPGLNKKKGLLALVGIICFISLVVCRCYPAPEGKLNCLLVGFLVCLLYSIVTRIGDNGLLFAVIKGGGLTLVLPFVLCLIVSLTDLMNSPTAPLAFIVRFLGLLTGLPVELTRFGGYAMDDFIAAFIYCIPMFAFLIRGIKAGSVYRKQRSEHRRRDKEYQQLLSSGFLTEFQQKEYRELAERYKEAMGDDWIDPVEIWKGE